MDIDDKMPSNLLEVWFHKYLQYIPESKLEEMYEAYVDYFNEHVEVTKNVVADSEGLTYHSAREI